MSERAQDGIDVAALDDGSVRIVVTAKGKRATLRVTPEYARRISGRLMAESMEAKQRGEPDGISMALDDLMKRRGQCR